MTQTDFENLSAKWSGIKRVDPPLGLPLWFNGFCTTHFVCSGNTQSVDRTLARTG
jgi:hypothetical protein